MSTPDRYDFVVDRPFQRVPAYDPVSRAHRWVVSCVYGVGTPGTGGRYLDQENIMALVGPYCVYCGRDYPEVAQNPAIDCDNRSAGRSLL